MADSKTTDTELVRKISAKVIMEGDIIPPSKPELLYTVIGTVNGAKFGSSNYGPWSCLVGQFEALRATDGKVFIGTQCFLPEPFNGMMIQAVTQAALEEKVKEEEGKPDAAGKVTKSLRVSKQFEFAVHVGVKPAKNAFKYEYTCTPIIELNRQDSLADLRAKAFKALPAPKK